MAGESRSKISDDDALAAYPELAQLYSAANVPTLLTTIRRQTVIRLANALYLIHAVGAQAAASIRRVALRWSSESRNIPFVFYIFAHVGRPSPHRRAPRPGDQTVSKRWLTDCLRMTGAIPDGVELETADLVNLDGNRGLTGDLGRIKVTYRLTEKKKDNTNKPISAVEPDLASYPTSFILKMSPNKIKSRYFIIFAGRQRESLFYCSNFYRDLPVGATAPKVHYAYGSSFLGEYVILMEDLALDPSSMGVNMLMGNQIWGIPSEVQGRIPAWVKGNSEGFPQQHVEVAAGFTPQRVEVLREIYSRQARMHAKFWKNPELIKADWLNRSSWFSGRGETQWELWIDATRKMWEKGKRTYAPQTAGGISRSKPHKRTEAEEVVEYRLSPKMVRILDASFEHTSWQLWQSRLHKTTQPIWTLCHGDFHASNMMALTTDKPAVSQADFVMYDWSEVGPWEPTTDLAQTLISDVRMEQSNRANTVKHTKNLVHAYWEVLVDNGVSKEEYSFERCWATFCRESPGRWMVMFAYLIGLPELPVNAIKYFEDQILAFIEAHGDYSWYPML